MEECGGTAGVFDLHVDELLNNEIRILSAPVPVLRYTCPAFRPNPLSPLVILGHPQLTSKII